jgi:hypothetical protein
MRLFLDIETAPQPGADTDDAYAAAGREPPSNYKAEDAIARWRAKDRAEWAGTLGLSPRTGRVVSIAWRTGVDSATQGEASEREAELVGKLIEQVRNTLATSDGRVVTFNGMGFDLHYLAIRAVALGLPLPPAWPDLFRRYSTGVHIDLFQVLTNWGASRAKGDSLSGWCRAFGIDAPVGSGAEVAGQVDAGQWASVVDHNVSDVDALVALYRRCRAAGLVP